MDLLALFGLTAAQRDAIAPEDFAKPPDGFPCDTQAHVDACATLIGKEPESEQPAIKKRAIEIAKRHDFDIPESWEDSADMGADGVAEMDEVELGTSRFSNGHVYFSGEVFESGNYPRQKIEMSDADIARACRLFRAVPIKDTHDESQSVFAGKLGEWVGASYEGSVVSATLGIPEPLVALFGKDWKPKVSVEIDRRTKTFDSIALVKFPQVTRAQVSAAFAAFAGARHSAADMAHVQAVHDHAAKLGAVCDSAEMGKRHSNTDQAAIQTMHDLACEQGATCPSASEPAAMSSHDPAPALAVPATKETDVQNKLTPWARFLAVFGKDPKALETVGITQAAFEAVIPEAPAIEEPANQVTDPKLAAAIAAFDTDRAMFRSKLLDDQAAKFANDLIYVQRKARAPQLESIKTLYKTAAIADGEAGTAKFSDTGDVVAGDAVTQLVAYFAAQPADKALMGQQISDASLAGGAAAEREARTKARLAGAIGAYNKGGN